MLLTARPLAFFGGKGGVGKTTLAGAYALLLARRGVRTLVVSTDPAHSLGDLFGAHLGDEPGEVEAGVWACEIDGEKAAQRRVEEVTAEAEHAVPREVLPAVERHVQRAAASPGTVESALVDRLTDLVDAVPGSWDRLVVDSAPTGHMLRLLSLPALLTPWIEGLVRQREQVRGTERMLSGLLGRAEQQQEDPLLARLRERRARTERVRQRLLDQAVVHLVLVPERLPLAETVRAAGTLADGGLALGTVVVNRVVPPDAGGLLAGHRESQEEVLGEVRQQLGEAVNVPLLDSAHASRAQLGELADALADAGW